MSKPLSSISFVVSLKVQVKIITVTSILFLLTRTDSGMPLVPDIPPTVGPDSSDSVSFKSAVTDQ